MIFCLSDCSWKDDFEMMKDVDVSGDFVVDEEISDNIEENEVKE